jgi:hypothetical protein
MVNSMDSLSGQKTVSRNRIRVRNALIEEIDYNNRSGLVTISYGVLGNYSMIFMEVVTLIVSRDTTIRDQFGQRISVRDLRVGMRIDAEFSTAMTRSIPPQTRAYRIVVKSEEASTAVTVDTVLEVDTRNNFLYTGSPRDITSQMRFVITNTTTILNRRGNRIRLGDLRRGETVRVEHANFQTPSIPPQTTAFQVRVL